MPLPALTLETANLLAILALLAAGLFGTWTAWACHRARQRGLACSDAVVWEGLALVFLIFAQTKVARDAGWLDGWGVWLRTLAKQYNFYGERRQFQIIATVAVAVIVALLLLYGLIWLWDAIKRYRLAIGLTAAAVGLAIIRFISLHEVDVWGAELPWLDAVVELLAAIGVSAIAAARHRQLRGFSRPREPG